MRKLYLMLMFTITSFALSVLAQVPSGSPALPLVPSVPVSPGDPAPAQWLVDLLVHWPKLSAALVIVGALRLVLKPTFTWLHSVLPAMGLVAFDQDVTAVEKSKVVTFIYWIVDYFASVKIPVAAVPTSGSSSVTKGS